MLNRRDFIRRLVGGGVGIALAPSVLLSANHYDVEVATTFTPFIYSDDFMERYIVPAVARLVDHVDQTIFRMYQETYARV